MNRVEFANRRGQKLVGMLHASVPEAQAAVISCHGMLSNKDGEKHRWLANELAQRGIPCLRFDFAGLGESEGRLFDISYSNEMEDLEAAIDWLSKRGVARFGLFGSSMGGAVALLAAARDERVVAVATLAAVGHPDAIAKRYPREVEAWERLGYADVMGRRIGRTLLDDALEHDVISAVGVLRAPVLILHGDDDAVVSSSDALDIASAAREVTLDIVMGADHRFSNPVHLRPAMRKVADFLAAQLAEPQADAGR